MSLWREKLRDDNRQRPGLLVLLSLVALLFLAGCTASAASGPRVYFISPKGGETVTSPVQLKMGAQNFIIEAANQIQDGHGHLHVIVDGDCVPAGQPIPKNATHLHYLNGEVSAELELAPGTHRLCLQAGSGAHLALAGEGMTEQITLTVQ